MIATRYVAVVAFTLCLAGCTPSEEPAPEPPKPQAQAPAAAPAETASVNASIFADPTRICDALTSEGFTPLPRMRLMHL